MGFPPRFLFAPLWLLPCPPSKWYCPCAFARTSSNLRFVSTDIELLLSCCFPHCVHRPVSQCASLRVYMLRKRFGKSRIIYQVGRSRQRLAQFTLASQNIMTPLLIRAVRHQ